MSGISGFNYTALDFGGKTHDKSIGTMDGHETKDTRKTTAKESVLNGLTKKELEAADTNKDGILTETEFKKYAKGKGLKASEIADCWKQITKELKDAKFGDASVSKMKTDANGAKYRVITQTKKENGVTYEYKTYMGENGKFISCTKTNTKTGDVVTTYANGTVKTYNKGKNTTTLETDNGGKIKYDKSTKPKRILSVEVDLDGNKDTKEFSISGLKYDGKNQVPKKNCGVVYINGKKYNIGKTEQEDNGNIVLYDKKTGKKIAVLSKDTKKGTGKIQFFDPTTGKKAGTLHLNSDGEPTSFVTKDADGNTVTRSLTSKKVRITSKATELENGHKTKTVTDKNGKKVSENEYDEHGNLVGRKVYGQDGNVKREEKIKTTQNADGGKTVTTTYTQDGKKVKKIETFDKYGNRTKTEVIKGNKKTVTTYVYNPKKPESKLTRKHLVQTQEVVYEKKNGEWQENGEITTTHYKNGVKTRVTNG